MLSRSFRCLITTLESLVLCIIKAIFSWIPLFEGDKEKSSADFRPSPSLVQVPAPFTIASIKEQLLVLEHGCFPGRCKEEDEEADVYLECSVCLEGMNNEGDDVRAVGNCGHKFHRVCMEGWVDHGQATCPLCRSSLLPDAHQDGKLVVHGESGDQWRRERMIYLFGEDSLFQ
uniref:Transcription factor RH2-1 n=1 Tax=Diospyros kaki TaxID=35925 RepID=A0A2P1ENC7_DIOKA|nr:transcription factor RH2-1 [Diospyros kaki]